MEELTALDIASYGGRLAVVVESDLLPPDETIVIIPLFRDYPAVARLNPTIRFRNEDFILATRMIASVQRTTLKRVGTAQAQRDDITRAIDILISGI